MEQKTKESRVKNETMSEVIFFIQTTAEKKGEKRKETFNDTGSLQENREWDSLHILYRHLRISVISLPEMRDT